MKRLLTIAFIVTLATACSSTKSRQITGPDGTAHMSVTCRNDVENCYEEATKVCPKGYDVSNNNSSTSLMPVYGLGLTSYTTINMLVKCR